MHKSLFYFIFCTLIPFFSFSYLFAAVVGPPLGLLSVKEILRKHYPNAKFLQ